MLDCKECKYYVPDDWFGKCELISKIQCRHKCGYPNDWCPLTENRDALIEYLISNFGDLNLKTGKVEEKYFVVARLQKGLNMFRTETLVEVEGNLFSELEDALADVLFKLCEQIEEAL